MKKFSNVFEKINFSEEIMQVFGNTCIKSLNINSTKKSMDIYLNHNDVIEDKVIDALRGHFINKFPEMNDIRITMQYDFNNDNIEENIAKIWNDILNLIYEKSPVCYKILSNSKFFVKSNKMVVTIDYPSVFLFIKKEIDKVIQQTIKEKIDIDLFVGFEYVEGDKKKKSIGASIEKAEEIKIKMPVKEAKAPAKREFKKEASGEKGKRKEFKFVEKVDGEIFALTNPIKAEDEITVLGMIIASEIKETRSGRILATIDITDNFSAITIKFFTSPEIFEQKKKLIKEGCYIKARGRIQFDDFTKELNMMAFEIAEDKEPEGKMDNSEEKRVELHLHTNMSAMDAMTSMSKYIKRAAKWGHKAIGLTDHGVTQAYPEAMDAAKKLGVKVLYGVEAYVIDDLASVVQMGKGQDLNDTFVVFDIETTGLSKEADTIIEIGAVKIKNKEIVDNYSAFVNPKRKIPEKITELTGITDDMVKDAETIDKVIVDFLNFVGDSVVVAHNAAFDTGFINVSANKFSHKFENTILCTLELARVLFKDLTKHKLNVIAEHLGVSLVNHHRAVDDANATALILLKCFEILEEKGAKNLEAINYLASNEIEKKKLRHKHAIIYAKNLQGLHNLYELVSLSHIKYFFKRPRIPKSELLRLREGLIIGSACEAGEIFTAVKENRPEKFIDEIATLYDYYEIQPLANNMYMLRNGHVNSLQDLIELNKKIVALGEKHNKPVVATCDVHFLDVDDAIYREIVLTAEGFSDASFKTPLYYRTTEEMLEEFSYLGEEKAYEVVVKNTNLINDMIEAISPIPSGKFPPRIEGSEEEIREITMKRAVEVYGDPLPEIVAARLKRELDSIILNGFSVMYIAAQKLVSKSMEDGYLVGSRGSVGSSLVATLSGITEVNPLSPHYVCKKCRYSDFESEEVKSFAGASGCDMPDKKCPVCGEQLQKEGHDIPFETFLGFEANKEPDIDLNFSGEYQSKAHAYAEHLFGSENVFKAGTISTLAEKTAYGYVRKFLDEKGIVTRQAEVNRLKIGCSGIKKTTGQHPGGLVILPKGHKIYEFCPVQRPANDTSSNITTTHFDYHSIEGRLLKLDLLGHDVPTIVRMLHDTSGIDPQTIDLGDKKVISLFTSYDALGVKLDEINCYTGTLGLPEFGTNFVRNMLLETKPSTFSELVRISGLSHGTDVWTNNAQDLVRQNVATLKEIIPTRDDIMVYLINKGVPRLDAFTIMESVRRGKGLTKEWEDLMKSCDVPEWYVESCKKIKYMFPKGHAVAYVMMTVRIGFYKIYYPYSFYAAMFSVKTDDFNYEMMCQGVEKLKEEMNNLYALGDAISTKEKSSITIMELVFEMYLRGLNFVPLDLYESEATKFKITPRGIMPPLCSVAGLGESVAQNIVETRKDGAFETVDDFRMRTKTNKTVIELLKKNGILKGIPESMQMTLAF